ncbi:carbohydrate kinase family protein [Streptomyces sp. NPDC055214]
MVGDVITDVVARHRTPPLPGTDTAAAIRTVPGGAGANVACWAASWGCHDVRFLGRAGADSARWHEEALTRAGVRARLVVDPEASTGTVICLVDGGAGAERTFLTDSGASLRLSADDWSPELLDGVGWLHLSGYLFFAGPSRGAAETALAAARARGVPVSVDPASAGFLAELGVERFLAAVDGADVLLPSDGELRLLEPAGDLKEAAAKLSRRFRTVVVKRGAAGALIAREGEVAAEIPALSVTAVDSTGAGDAFTGAFLTAHLRGADLGEAAREGCRAGARAVERVGGRPG